MVRPERRAIVAGLGMLAVAAAAGAASLHRKLAEDLPELHLEADIPAQFGDWRRDQAMVPVLPAPDVQARLDKLYSQLLTRTYVDSQEQRIMLLIAYGADQADRTTLAHLPESCYSSQGFEVFPTTTSKLPMRDRSLEIVRLQTRRGTRVEPISYWTTVGERSYADEVARRWARARYALRGLIPDGMLVRVSSLDSDEAKAYALQARFIGQLHDALASGMQARVFGLPA